ncbi:hypothetical protein [Prosthecobacter dejongeii]|uniref:Uncharacterized protein n=1 Tax=Prosthecobacter dejongeii TaxID=48465 RepID=A0A7W7YP83_9BACT|nr:hypothetical protein [Prosthecobacter dejongeii]MBB5039789.1 hypothetical protein [Prosthecobacter dejongeii]
MPQWEGKTSMLPSRNCLGWLMLVLVISSPLFVIFLYRDAEQSILQTKGMMKVTSVAIGHFRTEYNTFPISSKSEDKDVSLRSGGPLLAALMGNDKSLNPRGIQFVDLPFAKPERSGLIQEADQWRLVDRWGEMFYISLDTNYDNRLVNPAQQVPSKWFPWVKVPLPPAILNASSAIYSSGPDRDPTTWADNITSWR